MRRREFLAILTSAAIPRAALAQTAKRPFAVGYLYPGPQAAADIRIAAIVTGLRSGGLRSPEEVKVHSHVTEGDIGKLAPMAADFASRKVDLIIAVGPAAVRAAKAATSTIAIVASDLESDPVASGFITSYARPGGNITGTFLDFPEFGKKWLQSLRETVPRLSTVGAFWDPSTGPTQLRAVEGAAAYFNMSLLVREVSGLPDVDPAFKGLVAQGCEALVILSSPFIGANTRLLADLAVQHRLPATTLFPDFARNGGLMAYGPNLQTFYRQQGVIAAKILLGANVADMPIETPAKFEFVLNLKTALLLGLNVPPSVLLGADEVIE